MTSTLFISLPSRALTHSQPDWHSHALPFAWLGTDGQLQQQGQQTLAELRHLASGVQKLALLLAASDVSLLHSAVPPMSAAKLRQALPNLLEEQLIGDPADLVLVATPVQDGACTVAVADKTWLETVASLVKDWGVRQIVAYPAQLLLAAEMDAAAETADTADNSGAMSAVAIVDESAGVTELAVRSAPLSGLGLTLAADQNTPASILQMLGIVVAEAPFTLYVPAHQQDAYQHAAQAWHGGARVRVQASTWRCRTAGAVAHTPDLMSGVAASHKPAFDFAAWRWPLRLGAALLLVNLAALNFEWFSLKREAQGLHDSITQAYRNSFPKESVILDPLAQMQQKVNSSRRLAGQSTEDDLASLAAQFALAWDRVHVGNPGAAITTLEYKERSLLVKTKGDGAVPLDALRQAAAELSLSVQQQGEGVLQIKPGTKKQ